MTVDQYDIEDNNQEGMVEIDSIDELRPSPYEGVCIGCSSPYSDNDILFTDKAVIYDDNHAKKLKYMVENVLILNVNIPVSQGIYNHSGYSLFTSSVLNKYTTYHLLILIVRHMYHFVLKSFCNKHG